MPAVEYLRPSTSQLTAATMAVLAYQIGQGCRLMAARHSPWNVSDCKIAAQIAPCRGGCKPRYRQLSFARQLSGQGTQDYIMMRTGQPGIPASLSWEAKEGHPLVYSPPASLLFQLQQLHDWAFQRRTHDDPTAGTLLQLHR